MSLSMYEASVPVLRRTLSNLKAVLEKGAAHAQARKLEDSVFTEARLFPDMFPLCRQVWIATDMAKGCAARLAGVEPPRYEDSERSFAELVSRVNKTLAYLQDFTAAQIDGSENRAIVLQMRSGALEFKGQDYLLDFVLPNVYFHAATTYNILRHNGVELGKQDFLGKT
ncbi:hypothetical protein SAMN04488038_107191 [Solimonas aquatica]|uniref:DUF1993 domain-containing protein n=1 Tax=Solimonas aquatica TaxID=489703 RepID=A0A1H9GT61_9GAMM|nr:DUF1993 domain-containing protein [Solimonas aquatica]SEQ53306.1 hypothetical protein SAMN04488038_107191 [Solimonas aquatica]